MRLFCWNINALVPTIPNFRLTHGSLRGFFDSQKADVVCFQETKLLSEEKLTADVACVEDFEGAHMQSFWTFSRDKKGYSGVATYVARQFSPVDAKVDCLGHEDEDINREGRCVVTDLGAFVLINVYAPNAGDRKSDNGRIAYKVRFLDALKQKADLLRDGGREVIIVGDLNVAASQADVHKKYVYDRMYSSAEKEALQALLNEYTDIWRRLHPEVDNVFTVWDEKTSARVFDEGVRIDYVLLSAGLLQRVVSCEVVSTLPPKWSDHAALLLELRDIPPARPHPPCALSSARMKRFAKPKASIAAMFAKCRADDGGAAPAAKRARSDSAAADTDHAEASAMGPQGASQEPNMSAAVIGECKPLVSLENSEQPVSARLQYRCEDQAARSGADKVLSGAGHNQADVKHDESQAGHARSAPELPHDGKLQEMTEPGSRKASPSAADGHVVGQLQTDTSSRLKGRRFRSNPKAGNVPSSPKQRSIRGFFTAQL